MKFQSTFQEVITYLWIKKQVQKFTYLKNIMRKMLDIGGSGLCFNEASEILSMASVIHIMSHEK